MRIKNKQNKKENIEQNKNEIKSLINFEN